jgi:2-formylbenzoate dehydrogenase
MKQLRDRSWGLVIGGRTAPSASGRTYETWDPATGELIASVPIATSEDVDHAVSSARPALKAWGRASSRHRSDILRLMAACLLEHEHELAAIDAIDAGHPLTAMHADVRLAADTLHQYADWGQSLTGQTLPLDVDFLTYTVREPIGIVARIVPYNHPLMFAATRIALPLLAGNAVILKAPDQAPLSSLRLGELFSGLLPPGILSVLSGPGDITGDAIVAHPDIRRIGFIGSVPTGLAIQRRAAGSTVKTVTLELGGKNPMLVFPDADAEQAAHGAVEGMNFRMTAGQSCGSTSRLLVHVSLHDEVVERVRDLVESIRVDLPLTPGTQMGALVSKQHLDRIRSLVDGAVAQGAVVVTGGGAPTDQHLADGHFYLPTVLTGVTAAMRIAQEEVFGPVLVVMPWDNEDQMFADANSVPFGLTASVWTTDMATAHRAIRELDTGYVWVNTAARHFAGLPFGGTKDSGVGREECLEELLSYTNIKAVCISTPRADHNSKTPEH